MNKDIDEALKKVKEDIYEEPCVKEYLRLNALINNSKYFLNLQKEIKYLQKCNPTDEEKDEYYKKLKEYNSDPLIIEFKNVSEEVYNLLNEIKEEIES